MTDVDNTVDALPALPETLVNVHTGEMLPATLENAGVVLTAAREMKQRINDVVVDATRYVVEQSRVAGAKTLHVDGCDLIVSGGDKTIYDIEVLEENLREAGCPEDRLNALITQTISYKLNYSVLRQLQSANPDYRSAIEKSASQGWETPSVKVKPQ